MKERAWGKKINYQHEIHVHFDGKDSEAVTCTFFTDGLRAEKGQGSETDLGFVCCSPAADLGLELSCRGGKEAWQIPWT